jgi:hypothetical protein
MGIVEDAFKEADFQSLIKKLREEKDKEYEIHYKFEGGIFNPKLGCFEYETLVHYTINISSDDEGYYIHGNGD